MKEKYGKDDIKIVVFHEGYYLMDSNKNVIVDTMGDEDTGYPMIELYTALTFSEFFCYKHIDELKYIDEVKQWINENMEVV